MTVGQHTRNLLGNINRLWVRSTEKGEGVPWRPALSVRLELDVCPLGFVLEPD
jgi:hypothetical protein